MNKPIALYSSDSNTSYSEFAPLVKQMWEMLEFEPVYIKIGEGDFPEIQGIPTSLQAQISRLYAPKLYPDRMVITTDIDMLPFNKRYFWSRLPTNNKQISIYSADAWADGSRYPMCYLAAHGKTFEQIALDNPNETWEEFVRRLHALGHGWNTDEIYMTETITSKNALNLKTIGISGYQDPSKPKAHYYHTAFVAPENFTIKSINQTSK
jgi:hypothetical protein